MGQDGGTAGPNRNQTVEGGPDPGPIRSINKRQASAHGERVVRVKERALRPARDCAHPNPWLPDGPGCVVRWVSREARYSDF